MNIAHVLPYSVTYPLALPNGRYNWVLQLAQLQAKHGHNVTVYCNPSSVIDGVTVKGIPNATDSKLDNNIATFHLAFSNDHDIFHSHFDNLHYEVADQTTRPIVFTQHWWPGEHTVNLARSTHASNVWAVPPTKYMYEFDQNSGITTNGHIYHGVDLSLFTERTTAKNGRLLFVGRIAPEKNLELAITVAQKSGVGLDIIGKIPDKYQRLWRSLEPLIDGEHIRYLGTKSQTELVVYYAAAQAVIFPSDNNEAFGLVAIEAQACGTPVLMKCGGSRTELLNDQETGFLCHTIDDFVNAANTSRSIKPERCRMFASQFSVNRMYESYFKLYKKLV